MDPQIARELFYWCNDTCTLRWRINRFRSHKKVGDIVGNICIKTRRKGGSQRTHTVQIKVNGKSLTYQMSQVSYMYHTGEDVPKGKRIKFADGDSLNYHPHNLIVGGERVTALYLDGRPGNDDKPVNPTSLIVNHDDETGRYSGVLKERGKSHIVIEDDDVMRVSAITEHARKLWYEEEYVPTPGCWKFPDLTAAEIDIAVKAVLDFNMRLRHE